MKRLVVGLIALAVALTAFAVPASARGNDRPTIAGIVSQSGGEFDRDRNDFDILLTAVVTADLVGALDDPAADLTVFAPSDRAFTRTARDLGYEGNYDEAAVWDFLVAALTDIGGGDPIPVLTNILLYHVVPESLGVFEVLFRNGPVPTLLTDATIGGRFLRLGDNDPDIRDPRVNVFQLNIKASNGIIHGITRVLIPVDL